MNFDSEQLAAIAERILNDELTTIEGLIEAYELGMETAYARSIEEEYDDTGREGEGAGEKAA